MKKATSFILACILLFSLIPVNMQAKAASGTIDCSGFLSNAEHRAYVESKMDYYLNNYSYLQTALNNGKSVIFMFEGGSDNYPSHTYSDASDNLRDQAVVIVVQRKNGTNTIAFRDEACSTIPSHPTDTNGGSCDNATTILDGIYQVQTVNHQGKYGALWVNVSTGYYTPASSKNGWTNACSGINIHTRSSVRAGTYSGAWSLGCQLIGGASDSSNTFNSFMKAVAGINYNVWTNYISGGSGTFQTVTAGKDVGYYVVDRQLAYDGLKNLYTTTALDNITKFSKVNSKEISLSSPTYPTTLTVGDKFGLSGTITSGSTITSLTVGVFDGAGNFKTGKNNINPGVVSYDIKASADASVVFNDLKPGVYTYKIYAKNSAGGEVSQSYVFVVLAKDTTVSNGTYLIQCKDGGYVADIAEHSKSVNGNVQAATKGVLPSQAWRVTYASGGYYTIQNVYSGLYLDVASAASTDRTNIQQYTANTSDAQKWQILPTGSGYCLVPKCATHSCMDLSTVAVGGNLYIYTVHLGANQRFDLVSVSASEYQYTATFNGNGGANGSSVTVMKGDALGSIPTSSREGYIFDGWFTAADGGTQISASTVPSSNVTYYAHWTEAGPCSGGHTWDDGVVKTEATCTDAGEKLFTCMVCGETRTEAIAALGHDYDAQTIPPTCTGYEQIIKTCKRCGETVEEIGEINFTEWSETKPEGVDERLLESKTQYRYSDYETKTSYDTSMSGWTEKSNTWEQSGSGTISYVKSWPSGFYTGHSLYSTYNKSPKSASETATAKTTVSESVQGYLYYHWCRGSYTGGPINRQTRDHKASDSTGDYYTFHAFYSTTNPSSLSAEGADDGSRIYSNGSVCTDTYWYYNVPVYKQSYTTYKKLFTYERWAEMSAWSDTAVTGSSTRRVETRTLYRIADGGLGGHTWDEGVVTTAATCTEEGVKTTTCTVCGATQIEKLPALGHSYEDGVCTRCGEPDPHVLLKVGAVSGKAGDVVRVPVTAERNHGFAGFTMEIIADDALVLTDVTKGELLAASDSGAFTKNVRGCMVNWTDSENLTGDGVLFYLTFKIADDAGEDDYDVAVALRDQLDSNFVDENSQAVALTIETGKVTVKNSVPFAIVTQPTDQTVAENDNATFRVEATGDGLSYQWYYRSAGASTWYKSGATGCKTDTMTVQALTKRDGQSYRCEITDANGETLTTEAATLRLDKPEVITRITQQPQNVYGAIGSTATMTIIAEGEGLTYRWQYQQAGKKDWNNSGLTGYNTTTLSIPVTAARDGQSYRCMVTDASGAVIYSDAATLTVSTAPTPTPSEIKITQQPQDVSGALDTTVTLTVKAEGEGLTYRWQYQQAGKKDWNNSGLTGYNTDTMQIPVKASRDGQSYRCMVTDANGAVIYSDAATLTVSTAPTPTPSEIKITQQPQDVSGALDTTVTLTVKAEGTGLIYRWQYQQPGKKDWNNSGLTGYNTATLSIPVTAARNGQSYRCQITDANGTTIYSDPATLTVVAGNSIKITTQPKLTVGEIGSTVKMTVAAEGSGLTYRWQYQQAGKEYWYNSGLTGYNTPTLSIPVTAARDGQSYRCQITDADGNVVYTDAAQLRVGTPTKITAQPQSVTGAVGSTATITLKAEGEGLTYRWQYQQAGKKDWNNSGLTGFATDTLSVPVTAARNGQSYRCVITDKYGAETISDAVVLTVN